MSEYIMSPGARLLVGPNGDPYQSLGCAGNSKCGPCGSKAPLGISVGGVSGLVLLVGGVVAAAVLFPRVWKNFNDSLWG